MYITLILALYVASIPVSLYYMHRSDAACQHTDTGWTICPDGTIEEACTDCSEYLGAWITVPTRTDTRTPATVK